jgi:hypothetical protein
MKIIKLNEEQFQRLFENNSSTNVPSFNGGDIKQYLGSEVSTTTTVTNADGELDYGEQPTTDDFAKQLTTQNYFANSLKNPRLSKMF